MKRKRICVIFCLFDSWVVSPSSSHYMGLVKQPVFCYYGHVYFFYRNPESYIAKRAAMIFGLCALVLEEQSDV